VEKLILGWQFKKNLPAARAHEPHCKQQVSTVKMQDQVTFFFLVIFEARQKIREAIKPHAKNDNTKAGHEASQSGPHEA
jgi:hypothetical protein